MIARLRCLTIWNLLNEQDVQIWKKIFKSVAHDSKAEISNYLKPIKWTRLKY